MPQIHPHIPFEKVYAWGAQREQDILRLLADGLPPTYDLFHNLNWSATQVGNTQQISLHLSSGMSHWVPKILRA